MTTADRFYRGGYTAKSGVHYWLGLRRDGGLDIEEFPFRASGKKIRIPKGRKPAWVRNMLELARAYGVPHKRKRVADGYGEWRGYFHLYDVPKALHRVIGIPDPATWVTHGGVCCDTEMERPYSDFPLTCRHCGETRDNAGNVIQRGV